MAPPPIASFSTNLAATCPDGVTPAILVSTIPETNEKSEGTSCFVSFISTNLFWLDVPNRVSIRISCPGTIYIPSPVSKTPLELNCIIPKFAKIFSFFCIPSINKVLESESITFCPIFELILSIAKAIEEVFNLSTNCMF